MTRTRRPTYLGRLRAPGAASSSAGVGADRIGCRHLCSRGAPVSPWHRLVGHPDANAFGRAEVCAVDSGSIVLQVVSGQLHQDDGFDWIGVFEGSRSTNAVGRYASADVGRPVFDLHRMLFRWLRELAPRGRCRGCVEDCAGDDFAGAREAFGSRLTLPGAGHMICGVNDPQGQ